MSAADLIPYVILACCVLHNLCQEGYDDRIDDFIEEKRIQLNERGAEQNQSQGPVDKLEKGIIYNNAQNSENVII